MERNLPLVDCKVNIEGFKRESSELPDGGWFHTTTADLSSDLLSISLCSTETSSESSSADEWTGQRRMKHKCSIKIKTLFTTIEGQILMSLISGHTRWIPGATGTKSMTG
jgi:hypothetical protein